MTPISFARFRFGLEGFESITMSESMSYQGRPRAARAAKNDMLTLEIYIDIDEEGIG